MTTTKKHSAQCWKCGSEHMAAIIGTSTGGAFECQDCGAAVIKRQSAPEVFRIRTKGPEGFESYTVMGFYPERNRWVKMFTTNDRLFAEVYINGRTA